MIQSILEPLTILSSNSAALSFANDNVKTRKANCCGWLQHQEGSPIYKILEGGLYIVSFNANVTSNVAGPVALGLYQDGILVPGTTVITTVTTPGDFTNVSFNYIDEICCRGDASLTVQSVPSVLTGTILPGTATDTEIPIVQNARFSIIKKA